MSRLLLPGNRVPSRVDFRPGAARVSAIRCIQAVVGANRVGAQAAEGCAGSYCQATGGSSQNAKGQHVATVLYDVLRVAPAEHVASQSEEHRTLGSHGYLTLLSQMDAATEPRGRQFSLQLTATKVVSL